MRILHTYKSTNNGKFRDMPEKDAGGGRETGNLFGVALNSYRGFQLTSSDIGRCLPPSLYHALTLKKTGVPQVQGVIVLN